MVDLQTATRANLACPMSQPMSAKQAAYQVLQHHNIVQCHLITIARTRCESQHLVCLQ